MGRWPPFEFSAAHVRHDADGLLVVSKPPGLAVHATVDPARPHLAGAVSSWNRARGGDEATLHHRLDVDTSGLVLFVTDRSLDAPIGAMFANHAIDKRYLAVVRPTAAAPADRWRVENFLGRDKRAKATRYTAVRSGGKKAITEFEVIERRGNGTVLVEARPITGRAHQIRVHCAESGWPIVGDRFYGTAGGRLMLHAWRLRFVLPRGETLDVRDPGEPGFSPSR